jgi:hypothetical protein
MRINNQEIHAQFFAYDGCHKIYLIETEQQMLEFQNSRYQIKPISELKRTFDASCELRFVNSADLKITFVKQYEKLEI